ncbi:MAG: TerB family tellurite resistance protein [Candidatus Marinimicrobia bacterium]|nr:TerB family tellurite resistance protein [Candidatus Neomarinimicrobiota bacterium]
MNNELDSNQTQLAAACILLSVADADEILEDQELSTISEILQDFFSLDEPSVKSLMQNAQEEWKNSTGLFQFGTQLNQNFSQDDKLDFISCVFEVAYADGDLHYLEHHTVKKIANILHLENEDIISAKAEIENYLD